jgi:hypothetical protein
MNLPRRIAVIALISLASCSTPRAVQEVQRDTAFVTIREVETLHDTIIMVQLPEGSDNAVLPNTDTSRLRTSLAQSEAWVTDGRLHHTLRNTEALLPIEVKLPKYVSTKNEYIIREKQVIEQVEVERQLSKWQRFIMALGYGLLVSIIIWLAVKLARFV